MALALSFNYNSAVNVLTQQGWFESEDSSKYSLCVANAPRPSLAIAIVLHIWNCPIEFLLKIMHRAPCDHESHVSKNYSASVTEVLKCTCLSVPGLSTRLDDRLYFGRKQPLLKSQSYHDGSCASGSPCPFFLPKHFTSNPVSNRFIIMPIFDISFLPFILSLLPVRGPLPLVP